MLRKILPHAAIILSAMYFVFYCIDRVNPIMSFINNNITKALLVILGVISVINAVILISGDRREAYRRWERARGRGGRSRRMG